jgi:SNF2 family DNA or RNA helicase
MLAVLNIKSQSDAESALKEAQAAIAATKGPAAPAAAASSAPPRLPVVRDVHGAYVSRATLIICPVSLISQWIAELREKSSRPLKILSYHGTRTKDPRDLVDYDVVITSYSILSKESSMSQTRTTTHACQAVGAVMSLTCCPSCCSALLCVVSQRSKEAALMRPWDYYGPAGLEYSSPLGQVHWRRIVLDEGHSVKNARTESSHQANKLLGRCRYLMSGTPFGTSLMDLRGQTRFFGITGFAGTFLFNTLDRFLQSESQWRYFDLEKGIANGDYDYNTRYREHEWLKRFRNIFTHLVTHCMMRHEKSMVSRRNSGQRDQAVM